MQAILVLLMTLCLALPAYSFSEPVNEQQRQSATPAKRDITKEKATRLAQERYPGRVLKVQSDSRQYRVRVMQADGRVVNVVVDGRNGRVQREE
ncbi:PepSY domain-containing protein [Alishewanella jeotgali]|uniref:PepSY domain-containing protein n=1 Tax=Alishewanella jeotgali KCTC 22429 TaxID=1129374 RepID=H3ZB59_9ALTE|nr:PepSY domain-containing protein [Alishewanella jeotgali]EHR42173.1 hypothetical protein AJE_02821 [Alishewanella jeotgali KCTC 22429]